MKKANPDYKRRIRYIDPLIQRRMIIGLVVFELGLVVAGIIYLHGAFRELVELNLYSIHFKGSGDLWTMMTLVLKVSAAIFAINIPVVIIMMAIWEKNLSRILEPYRQALANFTGLNLRFNFHQTSSHPLLSGLRDFFEKERRDHEFIRDRLNGIELMVKAMESGASDKQLKQEVAELRRYVAAKNGP